MPDRPAHGMYYGGDYNPEQWPTVEAAGPAPAVIEPYGYRIIRP